MPGRSRLPPRPQVPSPATPAPGSSPITPPGGSAPRPIFAGSPLLAGKSRVPLLPPRAQPARFFTPSKGGAVQYHTPVPAGTSRVPLLPPAPPAHVPQSMTFTGKGGMNPNLVRTPGPSLDLIGSISRFLASPQVRQGLSEVGHGIVQQQQAQATGAVQAAPAVAKAVVPLVSPTAYAISNAMQTEQGKMITAEVLNRAGRQLTEANKAINEPVRVYAPEENRQRMLEAQGANPPPLAEQRQVQTIPPNALTKTVRAVQQGVWTGLSGIAAVTGEMGKRVVASTLEAVQPTRIGKTVTLPDGNSYQPTTVVEFTQPGVGQYVHPENDTLEQASVKLYGETPAVRQALYHAARIPVSGVDHQLRLVARIVELGQDPEVALYGDGDYVADTLMAKGWADDPLKAIQSDPNTKYYYDTRKAAGISDEQIVSEIEKMGLPGENNIIPETIAEIILDPTNLLGGVIDDAVRANRIREAYAVFGPSTKTAEQVVQKFVSMYKGATAVAGKVFDAPWAPWARTPQAVVSKMTTQGGDALHFTILAAAETAGKEGNPSVQSVVKAMVDGVSPAPVASNFDNPETYQLALDAWKAAKATADEVISVFPSAQSEAGKIGSAMLREILTNDEGKVTLTAVKNLIGDGTKPMAEVWETLAVKMDDAARSLLLPGRKGAKSVEEFVAAGGKAGEFPIFERGIPAMVERVKTAKAAKAAGLEYPVNMADYAGYSFEAVRNAINSGLWSVFAGTNPAVAARNTWNNAITAVIDGGFSMRGTKADDAILKIVGEPAEAKWGFGPSGEKGKGFGFAGTAKIGEIPIGMQAGEAFFSKRIIAKQAKDTLDRLMVYGKAIPELPAPLLQAMGDDVLKGFVRQFQLSNGDISGAMKWLKANVGETQVWRVLADEDYDALRAISPDLANKADDLLKSATTPDELRRGFSRLKTEYKSRLTKADAAIPALIDENVEEFSTLTQDGNIVKKAQEAGADIADEVVTSFEQSVKLARENRGRSMQAAEDFVRSVKDDTQARTFYEQFIDIQRKLRETAQSITKSVDERRVLTWKKYNDIKKSAIEPLAKGQLADNLWREYFNFRNRSWEGYTADFERTWVDWRYGAGEFDVTWTDGKVLKPDDFRKWVADSDEAMAAGVDFTAQEKALVAKMKNWIGEEDAWRMEQQAIEAFRTRYEDYGQVLLSNLRKYFSFEDGMAKPKGFRTKYRFAPAGKTAIGGESSWLEDVALFFRENGVALDPTASADDITDTAQRIYDLTQEAKKAVTAKPAQAGLFGEPPGPKGFRPAATAAELAAQAPIRPISQAGMGLEGNVPPTPVYAGLSEPTAALTPSGAPLQVVGQAALPGVAPVRPPSPTPMQLFAGGPNAPKFGKHDVRVIPNVLDRVMTGAVNRWGETKVFNLSNEQQKLLDAWGELARFKALEARQIAGQTGVLARNFTLLNYADRRNLDLWLSYAFPYHYWYGRTYANWAKRVIQNPNVMANYARYRRSIDQLHAGLPDYWKQQLSTDDLGIESDHPLYFNLEQSMSPMYGLLGIDYSDPVRRRAKLFGMEGAGGVVEDISQVGPTVWSPIVWAMALSNLDDPEAGMAWGNNYISGAARSFRSATALAKESGVDFIPAGGYNLDPQMIAANMIYGNGLSVQNMNEWERRRVGNIISTYQNNPPPGMDPQDWQAKLNDAGYLQRGPLWEKAVQDMFKDTAGPVLSSYFFGMGFKGRSAEEIQFDKIYQEQQYIFSHKDEWTPEEYAQAWVDLNKRYPQANLLALSRSPGSKRDDRWLWEAIGRVGVGNYGVWEQLGVSKAALDQFYNTKTIEGLDPIYRDELLGAALAINARYRPKSADEAQRQLDARTSYMELQDKLDALGGADIEQEYYSVRDEGGPEAASAWLNALDSEDKDLLENRWDTRSTAYVSDPAMAAYYADAEKYQDWLTGNFYDEMEKKYPDVMGAGGVWEAWKQAKAEYNYELQRRIKKNYPELVDFFEDQNEFYDHTLGPETERWLQSLPSTEQFELREDVKPIGMLQEKAEEYAIGEKKKITPAIGDKSGSAPQGLGGETVTTSAPTGGGTTAGGGSIYEKELAALEAETAEKAERQSYLTTDNKNAWSDLWLNDLVAAYGVGSKQFFDAPLTDQWLPLSNPNSLDAYVGDARSIREAIITDDGKTWTRVVAYLMALPPDQLEKLRLSDPRYADAVIIAQQGQKYQQPTLNAMMDILGFTAKVQEDGTVSITRKQNLEKVTGGTGDGGAGPNAPMHPSVFARRFHAPEYRRGYRAPGYYGDGGGEAEGGAPQVDTSAWSNFTQAMGDNPLLTLLMDYFDQSPFNRQGFLARYPELQQLLERLGVGLGSLEQAYMAWRQAQPTSTPIQSGGRSGSPFMIQRFYPRRGQRSGLPQ